MNIQNFYSRDSISLDYLESQDDLKELLGENNFLKDQLEIQRKKFENEKFELENKIKNFERDITKLKSSLNSANQMIEVYKVIDKQNENSEIKELIEKLKSKNFELEQMNQGLKKENSDFISEIENLKIKIKQTNGNNYLNVNTNNKNSANNAKLEIEYNLYNKNFNSIYSTYQGSSLNTNLHNQFSNETLSFNGKNETNNKGNNIVNNQENLSFDNKFNNVNSNNNDFENNIINSNKNFNKNKKQDKENIYMNRKFKNENNNGIILENDESITEYEKEFNESNSIGSNISFTSKDTNQIKQIFMKIKKDKNTFYENAVELMTENEIEIKVLKNENEDLKYILSKYEDEFTKVKIFLKEKYNIILNENEIFNIDEKSYENYGTINSNNYNFTCQTEKKVYDIATENSIKKDIKAFDNLNNSSSKNINNVNFHINNNNSEKFLNDLKDFSLNNYESINTNNVNNNNYDMNTISSEKKNGEKKFSTSLQHNLNNNISIHNNNINIININNSIHNSNKKSRAEEEKFFSSSSRHNNSFENEKNELKNYIESLENKIFENSKNYEEKISKLKNDLENMELEKNQFQQELENIQSNKKNLVEDIEYYSVTVRSLQDQKERLEDNLKNKIEFLITENKNLEQIIMKNNDQILILEKENKEIKEKENKIIFELKENYSKEKDAFDIKFKEITNRYFECNKEKEILKKENENLKQILERKKIEIDELIEKKNRSKEKKENEINSINENFKTYIDKLENNYAIKISKYQEKIKSLYHIIEKNIEKINSLTKDINIDTLSQNNKNNLINKNQLSKLKRTKSLLDTNFNEMKLNFNDIYNEIDLQLSTKVIIESVEFQNKKTNDYDNNSFNNYSYNDENKEDKKDFFNDNNKRKSQDYNIDSKNISPINDNKSNNIKSVNSQEYDLNISPFDNKRKFINSDNRKEDELVDLYGIDPKRRHNSYLKSMNSINFHSEISANTIINSFLNENNNIPLAFALGDEINNNNFKSKIESHENSKSDIQEQENEDDLNKTIHHLTSRKPNFNYFKKRSSLNLYKRLSRESIKKRLKKKGTKRLINLDNINNNNVKKEEMKEKFDFKLLKKTHEKEINELNNQITEYKENIKKIQEEAKSIDDILLMKELKEKNLVLFQENKNLKEEIIILKNDIDTLEKTKNEYISKLKKDVEKAEEIAAKAKFSMCQVNFEKDSEVLKYRNYCRKLKITIKTLEANNAMLNENINSLNSKYMSNKNVVKI